MSQNHVLIKKMHVLAIKMFLKNDFKKAYSLSAGATMANETKVQNKVKPKNPKKTMSPPTAILVFWRSVERRQEAAQWKLR